jgi:hypothetical protein
MTIQQQAEAIVEKYFRLLLPINETERAITIKCAITEVDAIIRSNPHSNPLNTSPVYSTMQHWMDILEHLKQM